MRASASAIGAPDRCRSPARRNLDELEHVAAVARAAGVECELLDGDAVRRGGTAADAGSDGGTVHEVARVRRRRPTCREHCRRQRSSMVRACGFRRGRTGLRGTRGAFEVQLDNAAAVTAQHVVVAAGSWSGQIEIDGVPPLPVRPVRGQLLQLASAAPALNRIVWGSVVIWFPRAHGSILVGATVEDAGFDERTTVAGVRDLLDGACRAGSRALGRDIRRRPRGTAASDAGRDADHRPVERRCRGCVYATGHYRNGVLLAPLTARAVADLVLDNREDPLLAPAAPQRFGEY